MHRPRTLPSLPSKTGLILALLLISFISTASRAELVVGHITAVDEVGKRIQIDRIWYSWSNASRLTRESKDGRKMPILPGSLAPGQAIAFEADDTVVKSINILSGGVDAPPFLLIPPPLAEEEK